MISNAATMRLVSESGRKPPAVLPKPVASGHVNSVGQGGRPKRSGLKRAPAISRMPANRITTSPASRRRLARLFILSMIGGRNIDAKGAVIGEHRQVIAPLRDEHLERSCRENLPLPICR